MTSSGIISYGGGVQSTALLVLWDQGVIDADLAIHANVGDDSEHPDTVRYVQEIALPQMGPDRLVIIHPSSGTLREMLMDDPKFQGIPIRMNTSGAPGRRTCTSRFKVRPIEKWKRENGYPKGTPTILGISTDEYQRAHKGKKGDAPAYPLLDLGYSRADCIKIIEEAGWPVPDKSACYFCPYHTIGTWKEMRRDRPDLFDDSVEIERAINRKRPDDDPAWLSSRGIPLDLAIHAAQETLFDACDSGHCFT